MSPMANASLENTKMGKNVGDVTLHDYVERNTLYEKIKVSQTRCAGYTMVFAFGLSLP